MTENIRLFVPPKDYVHTVHTIEAGVGQNTYMRIVSPIGRSGEVGRLVGPFGKLGKCKVEWTLKEAYDESSGLIVFGAAVKFAQMM